MASSSNDPSPSYCASVVERGDDSQNIGSLQMFISFWMQVCGFIYVKYVMYNKERVY